MTTIPAEVATNLKALAAEHTLRAENHEKHGAGFSDTNPAKARVAGLAAAHRIAANLLTNYANQWGEPEQPKPAEPASLGATMILPDDRYPFKIMRRTERLAVLLPVRTVGIDTGHQPASWAGPYAVWDHTYTDAELDRLALTDQPTVTVRLHKDRTWRDKDGIQYSLAAAVYRRDYSQ